MSALHLEMIDNCAPQPAAPATRGSLRVAIATQDMENLNAHFGSARRFAIYNVTTDGWSLAEVIAFDDVSKETGKHAEGDDRITPKVASLSGCHLLFCLAIGGPAAAKVVAAQVHPVKISEPQRIEAVLTRTRDMLKNTPPPWLRRILSTAGVHSKADFRDEY